MESHDKLKEINIKYRTCCYFDETIKIDDFDFDNIPFDEKSYKKILVYNISRKSLISAKPSHINFDKIDGFSRVYDGTRYLILIGAEKLFHLQQDSISYRSKKWYYICIFFTIMQGSKLIHRILYLQKKR